MKRVLGRERTCAAGDRKVRGVHEEPSGDVRRSAAVPPPPSFNHDCICCFAFTCICMTLLAYACRCHRVVIVCRYMLLYQFENLQYVEHKQEIEVQRGRSAAADASQRLRELMVSAGTGNHLSAVRFLWR